jgi:hypothetical protein
LLTSIKPIGFRPPPSKYEFKPRAYVHEISLAFDEFSLDLTLVRCINQPVRVKLPGKTLEAVTFSANLPDFFRSPKIKVLFNTQFIAVGLQEA